MNKILKDYLKNMLLLTTVLTIAGPIGSLFLDIDLKSYYGAFPYCLSLYALFFGVLNLLIWKKVKVKSWWKVSRVRRFFVWFFDGLDFIFTCIKCYWHYAFVIGISFFLLWMFINSIEKELGFFSGNFIYMIIGMLIPVIFGLGVRRGVRC